MRFERVTDEAWLVNTVLWAAIRWAVTKGESKPIEIKGPGAGSGGKIVLQTWSSDVEGLACLVYSNTTRSSELSETLTLTAQGMRVLSTGDFAEEVLRARGSLRGAAPTSLPKPREMGDSRSSRGDTGEAQAEVKIKVQLKPGRAWVVLLKKKRGSQGHAWGYQRSFRVKQAR